MKIKLEKCKFFEKNIIYLGHEISVDGIRPNPKKIEAIRNAPRPENLTQLKSYLGIVNYYCRFIPNLSKELSALYMLTKKDSKYIWNDECQKSFEKSKELLVGNNVLAHYDPSKEILLHCDASPYGLGAVLSHKINGKEHPVMFASCSLTQAQKNYAQLHREALAIIFAVKKFHKYIFGKKFIIYSDHQPLKDIFNEHKPTPIVAGRLQRWAIFLAMYDYKIVYKKGSKMGNADALSRLPLSEENNIESKNIHSIHAPLIDIELLKKHTQSDNVLSVISNAIKNDWKEFDVNKYRKYYVNKMFLYTENECIFFIDRLVIPQSLRFEVLKMLHETHIGMVRMKAIAKQYVWWPDIDSDIEEFVRRCFACQSTQNTPSKVQLSSWKEARKFFERIHIDFFHYDKTTFLILVDAYSKWFDVKIMRKDYTCKRVIEELRSIFCYFGLPDIIVSDNGPPFGSKEFNFFCESNGILCWKSPPYHPQSNGMAERGVSTVKKFLKKMFIEGKNKQPMELLLQNFLLKYRNTPSTTTNQTPSERIFLYRPKTLLDVMNKKPTQKANKPQTNEAYEKTKILLRKEAGEKSIEYGLNEKVLYKSEFKSNIKWIRATIIGIISKFRYKIKLIHGGRRECHGDQLRKFNEKQFNSQFVFPTRSNTFDEQENVNTPSTSENNTHGNEESIRRSRRLATKSRINYKQ